MHTSNAVHTLGAYLHLQAHVLDLIDSATRLPLLWKRSASLSPTSPPRSWWRSMRSGLSTMSIPRQSTPSLSSSFSGPCGSFERAVDRSHVPCLSTMMSGLALGCRVQGATCLCVRCAGHLLDFSQPGGPQDGTLGSAEVEA